MSYRDTINVRAVGKKEGIIALEKAFQAADSFSEKTEKRAVGAITINSLEIHDLESISSKYNFHFIELSCLSKFGANGLFMTEYRNSLLSIARRYNLFVEVISLPENPEGSICHLFISGINGEVCFDQRMSPSAYICMYDEQKAEDKLDCISNAYDTFYCAEDTRAFTEFMFLSKNDIMHRLEQLNKKAKENMEEFKF